MLQLMLLIQLMWFVSDWVMLCFVVCNRLRLFQRINSFVKILYWTLFISHNQKYINLLMFWSLSETFITRSWYSVLPGLVTTRSCRVKKAVISVAELIAALVSVHGLLIFLAASLILCMGRSDSLSVTLRWSHGSLHSVVGECRLVLFCKAGWALISGEWPLSWHDNFWSCHALEELSTSFFWWRSLTEIEMSKG